ncbi:mediator of RNA polymerase II transcription subunit 13 isoform X3 [Plutella xylostella]|uniref:mediator of RNA polymerase II transcription subunit 13 isoform X3 n=1 Tax=Plutella xylostella TaxID=51655 RepID=UPI00203285D0|nr:mediator of RNA polymerase II transcription subunit 13 isoform X3 [Plutella xylostella]
MTHQNHQTNGASLEDCHTNFFALTELYGIKWRKLVWGETPSGGGSGGGDGDGAAPLGDPVISSYARCLAGDILCVWRRVPAPQPQDNIYDIPAPAPPPPLSLRAAKELWIFWYGEEPDLNGLVAPELIASQGEQGSWESGLSYECRSLLFKALHNLIERCLLSRDFVRLGKWFVQPYDGDEDDVGKSPWHLSFSFAFFLHGESTVCASVDVRQHPAVRTLCARRLQRAQKHHQAKVILAPFGLEGVVTGREFSDSDPASARLLDAWRQMYPLEQGAGAVEVICGGVSMRYPAPYVLVTELEAEPDPAPAPARAPPAAALAARALRALAQPQHQTAEICNGDVSSDKCEDFVDPTRKTSCTCAKWRRRRPQRLPPFHRRQRARPPPAHHTLPTGGATACSPGSCGGGSPAAPASAPPSPQPQTTLVQHQLHSSAQLPTTLHTPAPTPDPLAPPTPAPPSAPPAKLFSQGDSPPSGAAASLPREPASSELLKRPVLPPAEPAPDPLEDEHSLHMLYDYTTVHAWLEHPVKRFKTEEPCFKEEMALGAGSTADLYEGHDHTKMAATRLNHDIKQEKEQEDVKEYKNLFTINGLCPTLKDLDQIFDNSDDASGDESLQVQTPPDSNKSTDDSRCVAGGRSVRAEELSKMFPTPPSMEPHAQPSPGFTLTDDCSHTPPPDPIEDWSYVFKPPTVCKYVGSSKYAPLTSLPSQCAGAVTLPSHAVYRPRWQRSEREPPPAAATTAGSKRPASPPAPAPRSVAPLSAPGSARPSPRPASPAPAAPAPACPLLLNVLLADTVLNIFRDHNFDSCTLCVCNAGPKVVGNIRGADAATYLFGSMTPGESPPASPAAPHDDDPGRCTCGFSAIVNRRLSHRAGLFYEDEMEITGLAEEPASWSRSRLADVAPQVLAACCGVSSCAAALPRAARAARAAPRCSRPLNHREYLDGGAAASLALRAASAGARAGAGAGAVHRWPFISARGPRSSRDVVRLMRRLRPLLQDAIQKRCCGARMWDGVTGPLTWRQFHRLAGRGNEDLCEPQPVPPLLVGHDRDWISLSPYAIRHWERLSLEPYAFARDVAYVVLAPDGDALTEPLRTFFRELSTSYESCRLGRHQPVTRVARDGIVRAAPGPGPDDAAADVPPGRLNDYLRAYREALRATLVPQLADLALDRSLFQHDVNRTTIATMERPSPSPMRPPSTPDHPATPGEPEPEPAAGGAGAGAAGGAAGEEEEGGAPALVVYVVEPPGAHRHRAAALHALLRLAASLADRLHHHNPLVKIISLEGVCETWGVGGGARSELRSLSFSVFTGARRLLTHTNNGKSLTGFGTAANANLFLSNKDEKNRLPYKLFSPLWVLAPPRATKDMADSWGQAGDAGAVLFLSYCLSHDQRWLLAAATDARGELRDTTAIDVHVPHRSRRRRAAPARRLGLTKLMDFTLGVMSQSAQPWRLVVGRVGRIGHGELKGWSWLLSRKNLVRASNVLREICGSCSVLYPGGVPCILSACLVSTEPDSCLRLMADRFTPDERFSQASIQSHLHTPRDVTATHILVFPTSATTQSNQMPFEQPLANGDEDLGFLGVDVMGEEMGEDNMNMSELFINNMFDMFGVAATSPRNSPRREDEAASEGSPQRQPQHGNARYEPDEQAAEAVGTVLQQPLALGYLVSTAPLGAMPPWWWAGCAHLQDSCPAFLKNALHLHAGTLQSADDFTSLTQRQHHTHPLDSQLTTDVLRYVLEGYNALSWLALDDSTHDRLSCLPIHVQVLMQLYHTTAALG